jgi:hypothetical protein
MLREHHGPTALFYTCLKLSNMTIPTRRKTMHAHRLALALCSVLSVTPATAGTMGFDFRVDITSGGLIDEILTGDFRYDDTQVTGVTEEFIGLTGLHFRFAGIDFDLDDGVGEAAFLDGGFLGLSYSVDFPAPGSFSFVPGCFALDEAYFSYDDLNGDGFGSIACTPAAVPAPASLVLLVAGLIGMAGLRKRSRLATLS